MRLRFALAAALLCAGNAVAYDFIEFGEPIALRGAARPVAAASSGDRLYVVDEKANALLVYDAKGTPLKTAGAGGQLFRSPAGVAVGPGGEVFVADRGNSRVQVLDRDGNFLRTIGGKGSDPGRLSKPASVAAGADGRIWVADTGNHRVQVFTSEGIFLFGFGGKGDEHGRFSGPTRIEVAASDEVFVLDEGNERIQKFGPDTAFAKEYKLYDGDDFAVDAYGFLYLLDSKRAVVKELDPDGANSGRFGSTGKGKGQFRKPRGIAAAPDGSLLVVDGENGRLQPVLLRNKRKESPLARSRATKLLVEGPVAEWPLAASALAAGATEFVAFLPKEQRVVVIGKDGKERLRFGGQGEAETRQSHGLALSPKLGIFAADSKRDRVQVYDLAGQHKSAFGATEGFFASKKAEGRVNDPRGIAVNEKGAVYVADAGNRRVNAYNPDGAFLYSFGPVVGPFNLEEPVDLAFDPAGFVFVLDRKLKTVLKCEPSGGYIKAWGKEGEGVDELSDPVALAYDGRSYLYVLDAGHRRVSVFDREGRWVTNFFAGGADAVSLEQPVALAVLGDRLIVADPARPRVAAFRLRPRLAPPAAISTKAAEGQVVLEWEDRKDPWIRRYRVLRATSPWGPYAEQSRVDKPRAADAGVEAYKSYFYRVETEADTGELGPASAAVEVAVPGAFNQAPIEIATVTVGNIFSANYKWYLDNPVGKAVIVNNVNLPFKGVKVSFRLKDFMDFATEKVLPELKAKERLEVPLAATLNNKILEVSEDTPIQAELTLTYFEKGGQQQVSQALPLKVYSRYAITWEDPRRIANYATPKDPPVLDLRAVVERQELAEPDGAAELNPGLRKALRVWSALGALGVKFLPSPNSPYAAVSEDPAFPVDYTQFPRDTLKRRSGECDDLVTLTASLLEAATVRTAMIDYPGHLALMFDTGASDPLEIGLPAERLVKFGDTWWIPLETTKVGSPFEDAAAEALHAYRAMSEKGQAKIIDLGEAWKAYGPATLPPPAQEEPLPDAAELAKRYAADAAGYAKTRYAFLSGALEEKLKGDGAEAELHNQLGLLQVQHGKRTEARKSFEKVLAAEPESPAALNNLGSLHYAEGDFANALASYEKAAERDPEDAGIWMNLARASLKLGRREKAQEYAAKASGLDKELGPALEALLK